jgi:hypothetical protein
VVSSLVSLSDASRVLGVSVERVRQLVVAGDLPAQRFGNAWAVPQDALIARRDVPASGGRPFGSVRAWMEIAAGEVDLGRPSRYRRRARIVRCEMSNAEADSLPKRLNAKVSGVRAAVNYGASLVEDGSIDLYLARSAFDRLADAVAYVVDPLGRVRLRVVDDEAWKIVPSGRFAPMAAVGLDLLESADPRHRIAAEGLIDVH